MVALYSGVQSSSGFTLVEAIIAIGLLTSGLVAFAYGVGLDVRLTADAKCRTIATIAASQKLEQLRATPSLGDVDKAAEYLDADGNLVCAGGSPCEGAVYARWWSIAAIPSNPRAVVIEASSRHLHRQIGAVVLRTVRSRDVP